MMSMRQGKLLLLGLVICFAPALPASAATMKECAAQWQKAKADNKTGGKTYKEFSKDCMAGPAAAAPAAAPAPAASTAATTAKPASKPAAAATSTEKKPSPAQEAMYARERACGAEWKEAKAAGKVKAGMKWPQYWSECNKRMKAAGK
jgi:hypothetical protein